MHDAWLLLPGRHRLGNPVPYVTPPPPPRGGGRGGKEAAGVRRGLG